MKDGRTKTILVLIFIVIILGGILIFKILNGNSNEKTNSVNNKSELIALIKSENNKSNYEVEYTLNDIKYNIKYLNKKMRWEASNSISYFDFEKNTQTIIDEDKKIAIIQNISLINENYMPTGIFSIIEDPNCKIKKEEKISNRSAIVLNYDGKEKIGDQFLFDDANSKVTDSKIDEINYNIKIWIDKETGFLLQTIMKANNNKVKTIYDLRLNSVTEADVATPNLSQYKVTDITSKQ